MLLSKSYVESTYLSRDDSALEYFDNNSNKDYPESMLTETNPSNDVNNQQPLSTVTNPVNDITEQNTSVPFKKVCMDVCLLCSADTKICGKNFV